MKELALTLKIELFLLIILVISFISSFITKIYSYTEIIAGVTLLLMSYNNQKYIKKKYMTPIYAVFGTITIAMAVYKVFNG